MAWFLEEYGEAAAGWFCALLALIVVVQAARVEFGAWRSRRRRGEALDTFRRGVRSRRARRWHTWHN